MHGTRRGTPRSRARKSRIWTWPIVIWAVTAIGALGAVMYQPAAVADVEFTATQISLPATVGQTIDVSQFSQVHINRLARLEAIGAPLEVNQQGSTSPISVRAIESDGGSCSFFNVRSTGIETDAKGSLD